MATGRGNAMDHMVVVTVGLAKVDDVTAIEAEAFEPLTFGAAAVSVYHLGNNGTAARHLKSFSDGPGPTGAVTGPSVSAGREP